MSCGCTSSYDGTSDAGYMDSFEGETPAFVPELNFTDLDNIDDGRMDFRFNDDGEEFDDFLTKRSRARLKRRKELRKQGLSRKDAKAQAVSEIPKQKLGTLIKNTLKGKTSEETKQILANVGAGEQVTDTPPVDTSMGMGAGMGSGGDFNTGDSIKEAGVGGNKKTMIIVAVIGVALIGGYFAFGKKLGLRK